MKPVSIITIKNFALYKEYASQDEAVKDLNIPQANIQRQFEKTLL